MDLPDPTTLTESPAEPVSPRTRLPVRTAFRRLVIAGWSTDEAGNLTGVVWGLRPARRAWTVREIEHLVFLRALVTTGRLRS